MVVGGAGSVGSTSVEGALRPTEVDVRLGRGWVEPWRSEGRLKPVRRSVELATDESW